VLLLDEHDVDALATPAVALAAARRTAEIVASGDLTTGRVQVGDDVIWSRFLVGILPPLDLFGYKQFHRVEKRVRYTVHLFRRSTGDPVALVDGRRITSLRTAATAAVAIGHHVAAGTPVHVGVIGSGEEAKEGLRMLAGTVRVSSARVFSPTAANREAFAAALGEELGVPVELAETVAGALDAADVAYVATSAAGEPFLAFDDVAHVPVVAAIGSTRPDQRELHGDVLARAAHVVVDCADARHEPGDVTEAVELFDFDVKQAVLLGHELATTTAERAGPVVFKSIGSVEQDLVLAHHLAEAASQAGRGHTVDTVASLRIMR
jgi:ornithine cyclodeaminase/alanine dehydrogenase-like protein (mu-crystallin family)